ncbi:hypothetical protein C7974DRAFT_373858 [Boeremia exigua]|uniref:uncharacterized protein n=1 Tax=Boeremia exigua TaxID=749465 RepID=UPI001E8D0607|nr:uncharacterized protein C7974DRAFT_373858 [Boeremia exigua]KAH6639650.1 hypothetical protein C7974DRAFT_373858 [Boeremia exigua]
MAILPSCPGLEVKVVSNGNTLKEFADNHAYNDPKIANKYIEVATDGAFEVHLQFTDKYTDRFGVAVEIRLDGQEVGGSLYRPGNLRKPEGHKFTGARSKIRGRWHISDFQFSQFVLDLDSRSELDQASTERLRSAGIITVLIHRMKNARARASKRTAHPLEDRPHGISKFGRVPEKAVKELGLSHHGSVDIPKVHKGTRSLFYTSVDGNEDEHAIAIFNFKCRSLATLKALSIVPTTPEHAILPSRPRSPDIAPASAVQEAYTPTDRDAYQVLSVPELLVLVREYRGSVDGLERLSRRDLTTLLEHYKGANK